MVFSHNDGLLVLKALDILHNEFSLIKSEVPPHLFKRIESLKTRFRLGVSGFSYAEIDTVCAAIEALLEHEPMNWAACQLLSRLQSYLQESDIQM